MYFQWAKQLIRKKTYTDVDVQKTNLRRCLTTLDLVGLGTGGTLGVGVYILTGQITRETAGPATVLSFLVAGLAATLSGLCYAEFASRVPRAGSAYTYSYVTVGELMAFVIGWNLMLEYVIGMASVARGLSVYLDFLMDNRMQTWFQNHLPMNVPSLAPYPDLFAMAFTFIVTGIVAVGVKESAVVNHVLTVINLVVISLIIVCGFTKADLHNWSLTAEEVPDSDAGDGGFLPFGITGVLSGAAHSFYAFVGFDFVACMGEETQDAGRSVPAGIVATLIIAAVAYTGVSAVVSLLCPYYLIDTGAPLSFVFDYIGWSGATYVVSVGAVSGIFACVLSHIYPMSRVIYAMASDGLVFRCLAHVSPRFHTPVLGTLVTGGLTGVVAAIFDLSQLINMMAIGTLLAFILVAVCVLILRYEQDSHTTNPGTMVEISDSLDPAASAFRISYLLCPRSGTPTPISTRIAMASIGSMCVLLTGLCAVLALLHTRLAEQSGWCLALVATLAVLLLFSLAVLARQPQSRAPLQFKVPLVPFTPAVSCLINVYLMFKLSATTWLRLSVWMFIGFCIYFFYGLRHSSLNQVPEDQAPLCMADDSSSYGAGGCTSIAASIVSYSRRDEDRVLVA